MKTGLMTVPIDVKYGQQWNMLKTKIYEELKSVIASKQVLYVHFAPPCNTFSVARYPKIRSPYCSLSMSSWRMSRLDCSMIHGKGPAKGCCVQVVLTKQRSCVKRGRDLFWTL